jgi:hypothetical protein
MTFLSNFVGRAAGKAHKINSIKKEWLIAIIVFHVARLGAMGVSIYAGFYYISYTLSPVIQNPVHVLYASVTILVMLELLNMVFLSKALKFGLHFNWKVFISAGIVAAGLYTLSFIISTNGLAMRMSRVVDNSDAIIADNRGQIAAMHAEYDAQIVVLRDGIRAIDASPGGWKDGRKDGTLTPSQLTERNQLTTAIAAINAERRANVKQLQSVQENLLAQNRTTMSENATKYYEHVSWVMFSLLFSNFMIAFFNSRIAEQDKPEQVIGDQIELLVTQSLQNFDQMLKDRIGTRHALLQYNAELVKLHESESMAALTQASKELGQNVSQVPATQEQGTGNVEYTNAEEYQEQQAHNSIPDTQAPPRITVLGFGAGQVQKPVAQPVTIHMQATDTQPSAQHNTHTGTQHTAKHPTHTGAQKTAHPPHTGAHKTAHSPVQPANSQKPQPKPKAQNARMLGMLRTNDALASYIIRKKHGQVNFTAAKICNLSRASEYKYHEFRRMLEAAGFIPEQPHHSNN